MKKFVLVGLLRALLFPLVSHAQGLGSILGTVTDPSGAAIASAKITVTQAGTSFSRVVISNSDGSFVISSLSPADYSLTTEAKGFSLAKRNVTLLADQSLTVGVKMQLGMANQVLEVAVATVQVDTATSTLSQVIEQQRIAELPLNGRNAAARTRFACPRTSDWDVQIFKYISLTEGWKLQLRAEYFNVLNHPNFAPESTSCSGPCATDQISGFDKLNGNSSFGTFRADRPEILVLLSSL